MAKNKYSLGLIGATGVVGREVLDILNEKDQLKFDLKLLASDRSKGKKLKYSENEIVVEKLTKENLQDLDFAIFTAGGEISGEFVPLAAKMGIVCIDNSSVFRMDQDVPLIVPEVNKVVLKEYKKKNIIANPNCTTAQLVMAIAPINRHSRIKRIIVSTYQSVSGAGKKAIDELSQQVISLFNNRDIEVNRFPHQIAFNCIPHIDVFDDEGNSREETKVINETRKIMGEPEMGISVTAVRVPVFSCHCETVNIETEKKLGAQKVREILSEASGVTVVDDPLKMEYPLPLDAQGTDDVFIGRIRDDLSRKNCINMWIVADNLRKGAALNAVQILECLAAM